MGNSVHGQNPSIVFEIIRNNILNPSDKQYVFNKEKYDFLSEILLLIEKEKKFYNYVIKYTKMMVDKRTAEEKLYNYVIKSIKMIFDKTITEIEECEIKECIIKMIKCGRKMTSELERLELVKQAVNNNEPSCEELGNMIFEKSINDPDTMSVLHYETMLLSLTYGRLQLELGEMLLKDIFVSNIDDLTEKNEMVYNLVKEKWDNMSVEQKSAKKMQNKAVVEVNPCRESYNNWVNNAIL